MKCCFSILSGPEAPSDWQGRLNFTYRIGPGFNDSTHSSWSVEFNGLRQRNSDNMNNIYMVQTARTRQNILFQDVHSGVRQFFAGCRYFSLLISSFRIPRKCFCDSICHDEFAKLLSRNPLFNPSQLFITVDILNGVHHYIAV